MEVFETGVNGAVPGGRSDGGDPARFPCLAEPVTELADSPAPWRAHRQRRRIHDCVFLNEPPRPWACAAVRLQTGRRTRTPRESRISAGSPKAARVGNSPTSPSYDNQPPFAPRKNPYFCLRFQAEPPDRRVFLPQGRAHLGTMSGSQTGAPSASVPHKPMSGDAAFPDRRRTWLEPAGGMMRIPRPGHAHRSIRLSSWNTWPDTWRIP